MINNGGRLYVFLKDNLHKKLHLENKSVLWCIRIVGRQFLCILGDCNETAVGGKGLNLFVFFRKFKICSLMQLSG